MVTAGNLKETGDPHQSSVVYKSWESDRQPLPQADREATGKAVAVGYNCGNLEPVAKALRAAHPDVAILVCGDDDHATGGNPGRRHAPLCQASCRLHLVEL